MAIIQRGANIYLVRIYLGRDPITKKRIEINQTVHGTLGSAKKVQAKLKAQHESGHLAKTPRMTLDALLDLYMHSSRHHHAESTKDKLRTNFRLYVRPYIGSLPLKKIDRAIIQNLFNLLLDKKAQGGRDLSYVTVMQLRKVLKVVFNYAIDEKLMTDNPARRTKLPQGTQSNADSMTIEETEAFVSVKTEFWYGTAFVFQLHTGLRPQELMGLIWEDIDFKQGTLRVERGCKWLRGVFTGFGPTKSNRSDRVITLEPKVLTLLRTHRAKQQKIIKACEREGKPYGEPKLREWVSRERPKQSHRYDSARLIFARRDGSSPNHTVPRTEFKEMLKRAGIQSGEKNYRWYDIRHTHATIHLTLGTAINEVAERMGHSKITLLNTYAHVLKNRRRVAASLFGKHVPV